MTRDAIATDKLAAPVGPFSLGVRGVGLLFLSGQVAQDPATAEATIPQLAWEFNFPEPMFVLPPSDPSCTCRVRIFTPRQELPFAGHATVGTAAVLARRAARPSHRGSPRVTRSLWASPSVTCSS